MFFSIEMFLLLCSWFQSGTCPVFSVCGCISQLSKLVLFLAGQVTVSAVGKNVDCSVTGDKVHSEELTQGL